MSNTLPIALSLTRLLEHISTINSVLKMLTHMMHCAACCVPLSIRGGELQNGKSEFLFFVFCFLFFSILIYMIFRIGFLSE